MPINRYHIEKALGRWDNTKGSMLTMPQAITVVDHLRHAGDGVQFGTTTVQRMPSGQVFVTDQYGVKEAYSSIAKFMYAYGVKNGLGN